MAKKAAEESTGTGAAVDWNAAKMSTADKSKKRILPLMAHLRKEKCGADKPKPCLENIAGAFPEHFHLTIGEGKRQEGLDGRLTAVTVNDCHPV